MLELKEGNEDLFYLYELFETMEERAVTLLDKVLNILEYLEKPSKKFSQTDLTFRLIDFCQKFFCSMSDDILDTMGEKLIEFMREGTYINATLELGVVLHWISLSSPHNLAPKLFNLVYSEIISKVSRRSSSLDIISNIQSIPPSPDKSKIATSINNYKFMANLKYFESISNHYIQVNISKEKLEYYIHLLISILSISGELIIEKEEEIEILIGNLLQEKDMKKYKLGGLLLKYVLECLTTFEKMNNQYSAIDTSKMQDPEYLLNLHRHIGTFNLEEFSIGWKEIEYKHLALANYYVSHFVLNLGEEVQEYLKEGVGEWNVESNRESIFTSGVNNIVAKYLINLRNAHIGLESIMVKKYSENAEEEKREGKLPVHKHILLPLLDIMKDRILRANPEAIQIFHFFKSMRERSSEQLNALYDLLKSLPDTQFNNSQLLVSKFLKAAEKVLVVTEHVSSEYTTRNYLLVRLKYQLIHPLRKEYIRSRYFHIEKTELTHLMLMICKSKEEIIIHSPIANLLINYHTLYEFSISGKKNIRALPITHYISNPQFAHILLQISFSRIDRCIQELLVFIYTSIYIYRKTYRMSKIK